MIGQPEGRVHSLNVTPPTCREMKIFRDVLCDIIKIPPFDDKAFKGTLYVPSSAVEDYKRADQWSKFAKIVGIETSAIKK